MKDTRKCVENRQLHREGCQQEDRVELEDNAGVFNIFSTSEEESNDGKRYTISLLEEILDRSNMNRAYIRVKANKGKHGIDGMTVDELQTYLKENGDQIRKDIMEGTYRPKPVRRVEIPKLDGGIRLLGIPTVLDRVIQQAIAQVLTPIFEREFSEFSYGFRPNRNAHQAIKKCKEYIDAGYKWAVDIDLAKYFDTVNHDKLMRLLSQKIKDGRVLSLIRKYLQSGVMVNGVVMDTEEGTPQGGNLSPLLSNIMLDELDKELTKRGLKFCRYADEWLRRRIRMCFWKRWKKVKTRFNNLFRLGIDKAKAWEYANTRKGYWRISNSPILSKALTNEKLKKHGFPTITERYLKVH